jgi:formyl-CoA transferase
MRTIGVPVKFSETGCRIEKAAPLLGQDTSEVLRELGYGDAEIDSFIESGAVST